MLDLLAPIQRFFDILVAGFAAASLAAFFWGLVIYITESGDEAERLHGKRLVLASTTALLVLMLLWGALSWLHLTSSQHPL